MSCHSVSFLLLQHNVGKSAYFAPGAHSCLFPNRIGWMCFTLCAVLVQFFESLDETLSRMQYFAMLCGL